MGRALWIAGLMLIWASVAAITVGTYLLRQSPQFEEFRLTTIREEVGTVPDEKLHPAGRMALELSFTWQFGCGFSGFLALLFTAGGLGIRVAGRRHRELALIAAGAFGLGCLVGSVLGFGEAIRNIHWGLCHPWPWIPFLECWVGPRRAGCGVVARHRNNHALKPPTHHY